MATPAPFARRRLGRRLSAVSVAVVGSLALAVAGALGVAAAPTLHGSSSGTHATLTATAVLSVTAICSPAPATYYLWQVSVTGQTETSYTVDYSATGARAPGRRVPRKRPLRTPSKPSTRSARCSTPGWTSVTP
jgi:hypothetical protein